MVVGTADVPLWVECSKFRKIKVGKEVTAPLKGRVFKIQEKSRLAKRRQRP